MSTTTAAGPPAARPAPLPHDDGMTLAALLKGQRDSECALAEALARFQSDVSPATTLTLPAVVEAARAAFRLGFAYSVCRALDEDGQPLLEVTVMHRGGDQLSSQARLSAAGPDQEFTAAAHLLAQLLGIPVLPVPIKAQPCKAEPEESAARSLPPASAAQPVATASIPERSDSDSTPGAPGGQPTVTTTNAKVAAPDPDTAIDRIGPGCSQAPATEEALLPLNENEREVLLEMIRSLRPVEARRQFQIAFRHHFQIPKEARSIAGFITQQRHKQFIDRFERELADLPSTAAVLPAAEQLPAAEANPALECQR